MEEYFKEQYGKFSKLNIFYNPIDKDYYKFPDEDNYENIFYINDDNYSSWEIYPALDINKGYNRERYTKKLGDKNIEFFKFEIEDFENISKDEIEIIPAKLEYGKLITPGIIKQKTKEKTEDFISEKGEISMEQTLTHINEIIEKNKMDFKYANYLNVLNEISKIEDLELNKKLSSKLKSIYNNRINGKGVIRGNELAQIIKEFNELQDIINQQLEILNIQPTDISEDFTNENLEISSDIPEINESEKNNIEKPEEVHLDDDGYSSFDEWYTRDIRQHSQELRNKIKERVQGRYSTLGEDIEICKEFLKSQKNKDGNQYYTDEYLSTMTNEEIIELANAIFDNTNAKNNYYNRNLLYGLLDNKGIRKYTDEEIQNMNDDKVNEIISKELNNLDEEEINRVKNRARREELLREKAKNTPISDNYEDLINKFKEQLTKETPIEEAKIIIDKISETIMEIYKKEEIEFEENLKNANTLESKLEIIEKRESRLKEYQNFYHFEQELNPETLIYIEEKKKDINNKINEDYNNKKQNGEYCWKEFNKINESKKYIDENIKDNLKTQFNELINKMYDIVNNPNQEEYDKWKNNMNEFVNNSKLDKEKITPYLTAQLQIKYPDKKLTVNKNFDIDGLGLNKTKEKPIKKRAKVKKVEKGIGPWFKKHKNKLILIGIGLALTTLLVYQIPTVQMMINSALWGIGKAKGTLTAIELANLHSANLGIAQIASGGKFAFEAGSGLYTLGGTAGAEALYTAGQAGLVNSLMTIAKFASGGLITSGLISHVVEKIQNWKKKKTGEHIENDRPEIKGEEPEKIEKDSETNGKKITQEKELTREELLEIIKRQEETIKKQEERMNKQEETINKQNDNIEEYKKIVEELKNGLISSKEEQRVLEEQNQQMDPEQKIEVQGLRP